MSSTILHPLGKPRTKRSRAASAAAQPLRKSAPAPGRGRAAAKVPARTPAKTLAKKTRTKSPPKLALPARAAARVADAERSPFLTALGERVRELRARRGLTRRAVAQAAQVSERHLANLEYGVGNASILVLVQVAAALQCSLAELMGDVTTTSAEWLSIRELLEGRDASALRRARSAIGGLSWGAERVTVTRSARRPWTLCSSPSSRSSTSAPR